MKRFFLRLIRFYQKYLSFDNGFCKALFLTDKACRFQPTCSEYSYQAVYRYGIIRGGLMSLRRIARCHPWNQGGFDPVK